MAGPGVGGIPTRGRTTRFRAAAIPVGGGVAEGAFTGAPVSPPCRDRSPRSVPDLSSGKAQAERRCGLRSRIPQDGHYRLALHGPRLGQEIGVSQPLPARDESPVSFSKSLARRPRPPRQAPVLRRSPDLDAATDRARRPPAARPSSPSQRVPGSAAERLPASSGQLRPRPSKEERSSP